MRKGVLLDTSFFMRFLNNRDSLFHNADKYFKYFIERDIDLFISTISIAEYCIEGKVSELPLLNLKIIPFNLSHALRAGELGSIAFAKRRASSLQVKQRVIIPNDTKLFAQADSEKSIEYYLSSDVESQKVYKSLKDETTLNFKFINLNVSHNSMFGVLGL